MGFYRIGLARATPHTRGSTYLHALTFNPNPGYPAHAGIDLKAALRVDGNDWLPRTRGDRPGQRHDIDTIAAATPHTRGSTYPRETPWPLTQGYPAHAGIDLDFGPV